MEWNGRLLKILEIEARGIKNCEFTYLMCYSFDLLSFYSLLFFNLDEFLVVHELIGRSMMNWISTQCLMCYSLFPLPFSSWVYLDLYEISTSHLWINRFMKFLINYISYWSIPSISPSIALVILHDSMEIWIIWVYY